MIRLLLITQTCGPDYLSDLVFTGISKQPHVTIDTNFIAPYHWNNYAQLNSIYGRGFTAFGLLDNTIDYPIRLQSTSEILHNLVDGQYDYVIYTSIQREALLIDAAIEYMPRDCIFVLDGEDNCHVLKDLCHHSSYFKREINEHTRDLPLYPISFKIDSSKIFAGSPDKLLMLSVCDPRDRSTYIYNTESEYYSGYRQAYFAITMRKGGWDCMRHYEIIANGSLPLFLDISEKPSLTMADYPVDLQLSANNLFYSYSKNDLTFSDFSSQYISIRNCFLSWLLCKGTTSSYLPYLISSSLLK